MGGEPVRLSNKNKIDYKLLFVKSFLFAKIIRAASNVDRNDDTC